MLGHVLRGVMITAIGCQLLFSRTSNNYGITSEEEYLTAGGSDTEVGEAMDDRSITKPPEVLFFNHSPVKLKALSSLCLTCELDGIPEPDIKWFRNGQIIFDGRDGYQIKRINFGKWSLFLNQTTKVSFPTFQKQSTVCAVEDAD